MRMQKLMETNMTTKITQSHTATLSAIHDAWEQLLKSRGLDFVEGPAAIVEAEGEAYLISWKVKGQRPYWLIVTYAMTGGLHPGVTRFGIDGHGFEFSIRVPAKNKERSPSDKVCAMLTNLIGTARRAPEHVHSGFAVVNSVKRANGRHLADLVLLLCDDRDLPEVQTPNGRVAFLAAQFITREELELCMKGNPDYFSAVLWEKTTPHGLSNFSRKPIITSQIEAACIEADESGLKDATDFQGDFEITRDAQGRTVLELGESGIEHFRRGENRTQGIFAFRDALEAQLEKACGPDVVRMVGGATGVHFGYVDFMAWDLQPVLFEARAFLEASDVPASSFHVFRREVGSVPLKSPDDRADAGEDDDDEPLDYRPEMAEAFHARIQKWNDDDEYTRCIRALDGVPTQYRDYRHAYALARALENYAVLGDGQYGCPRDKAREALRRAIGVLESVREEGLDRAEWHMRMAYGYQYLTGEEEKAIPYARTWAQLDPEDEDAPCVIRECEKAVEARCKNDGKPVDRKDVFLGFVLLEKAHWDKGRLIADLKAEWDIDVPEEDKDDRKDNGDSLVFEAGDMIAAVSLMHGPVPGGEAEDNAENNYMWPDAVKAAQSHAAHIMVTVLGKETDVRLRGQFFVKLAAACCRQPGVLGVYTSGVVFEPSFYADMAGVMKEGELPLNNWIWFGLHRREGGVCGYTYGMDVFGKEELEVLDADADPLAVREFLVSLAGYVIGSDVTLNDGETIGFSQGDRHRITRSPGVALPDQPTLKVSFEQNEILLDEAAPHLESIREKCLPVDELNAFSHLAIYLRWCIEHDLMSESFCRRWPDIVEAVRTNPAEACLREWLRDKLKGELHASIFNERGADFACYYYYGALHEYTPHYTMDVDIHAVSRIGVERNFSDEIQDEAYLFLPFDEDYYREMARIIERRYENWAGQRFDDSTLAPSETAEALMAYLDCECTYFPSMADDDPIMCAYEYAGKNAAHEGFVPMLIAVDETLWECLMLNSDPAHEGDDDHAFDPDAVAAYRQSQLAAPLPDGRMVLEDGMAERRAEAEDDSKDWDTEVVGRMEGGFNNHRFSGYWNSETDMTHPVILARIPVRHPWEVFAHLPFGNWNDCPDTPQLMAVARYWFEKFGAVPAVMTHDELDFALPKPIGWELAVQTALEQYAFCPDMDQNHESVGALADTLRQSKIWYFWWD